MNQHLSTQKQLNYPGELPCLAKLFFSILIDILTVLASIPQTIALHPLVLFSDIFLLPPILADLRKLKLLNLLLDYLRINPEKISDLGKPKFQEDRLPQCVG
mmetsp:Transcript_34641/g.25789  ORF Transcript_34641/g.25789 Transcript_34641/m.25789 type:complete len:102 (+) Transcript_34641:876-1181(+)